MNPVKAKEIATSHINVAFHISQSQRNLDYIQVYSFESMCILGETKEIPRQVEAKMTKQYNKNKVLRALCLLSTTQGGLSKTEFDSLRRTFIMNYGYQEIVTLMNLQDAGLFKLKDKKAPGYFDWNWEKIKNVLNLVNEDINLVSPSDFSFVHNGYAPISIRLIEMILENNGIQPIFAKGCLRLLGLTEDKIHVPREEAKFFSSGNTGGVSMPMRAPKKKKILVYFVGGITYAEIAAIRFLQNIQPGYKFVIATTSIINGETALTQMEGS